MRILYVTLGFSYGAGNVLRMLIAGMSERGHDIAVVSKDGPADEWDAMPDGVVSHQYGNLMRVPSVVHRTIKQFAPDVIHGHMLRESALATIAWRACGRPAPYLHREPGQLQDRSWVGRLAFRFIAGSVTRIASPSEVALETWASRFPVVRRKGIAISNAITLPTVTARAEDTREALGVPADTKLLVNVAAVNSRKNQKLIATALGMLDDPVADDVYLVIAGGIDDEEERDATVAAAEASGVADRVIFAGFRSDIPELYAAADIAVLSSTSESFGIAVIEAMAAGKPVVSTACGGPDKVVIEDETGFLVPIDEPSAMARAIQSLLDNPQMARDMGIAGRERVSKHYSIEAFLDAYEGLYSEMIGRCGAGGT